MPEVERDPAAAALLSLVLGDDLDLRPGRPFDDLGEGTGLHRRGVGPDDRVPVGFERHEQRLVAERRHLHDLAHRGPALSLGEGTEGGDVDDDGRGLVEGAEQVLALGKVDAGLAADGRVDLGDERGRDLDPGHAPQVRGGEEARRIAERAAADRDERVASLDPQPGVLARRLADHRELLGGLARGQHDVLDRPALGEQALAHAGAERRPGAGLGDQDRPSRLEPVEGLGHGGHRDPLAEHDVADPCRGVEQHGGRRDAGRDEPVHGLDHPGPVARRHR